MQKILVADDEPLIRSFLSEVLRRQQFEVTLAEDGEKAIQCLKTMPFDLVISDMKMGKKTGLDVLKFAKSLDPNILIIIMTAYGTIENAVEAMNLGAFHYLIKPFSPEAIETILEKARQHLALVKENTYLREEFCPSSKLSSIVAASPQMKKILKDLEKIALSNASVFISGESGTGKEVISAALHAKSLRRQKPFIKVNCAAIPETLIESEFFGYEKGAFTGADKRKAGRFELAHTGSLLLDEVTEIPLSLQPKLLRAIQEKEFERVGGTSPIKVDVRLISTSNRKMDEAIASNIFREDLFYRLNVVPIHIPALRERPEDIVPLAQFFLDQFCLENHKRKKELSPSAADKLISYSWPGNVRELANIIERTVVLHAADSIEAEHLCLDETPRKNPKKPHPERPIRVGITLAELEKTLIKETLTSCNFNRTQTAKILGISIRTLRNKLKEYESIS